MKGYKKAVIPQSTNGNNRGKKLTLSNGETVHVIGVSHVYFEEVRRSVKFPDPPTYTVITAGGGTETHVIDESVVNDSTNTEEERQDYQTKLTAYNAELEKATALQQERINKFLFYKGVEVSDLDTKLEKLREEREFLGMDFPASKAEQKYAYIYSMVVGNTKDYTLLLEAIMQATGIPETEMAKARDLFRDILQEEKTE